MITLLLSSQPPYTRILSAPEGHRAVDVYHRQQDTWVQQEGRYWIAKAFAFSENDNDVTLSACHSSPS